MPQDVNIRTASSVISSSLYDDRVAVVQPVQFGKIAPHVTEKLQFQPATGQFQPGTTATWRLRRLGDHILDIKLVATARELSTMLVAGSFIRYPDRAPCVFVKEIRLRYNHTRLQTIRPGELQMHIEFFKDEDDKFTANNLTMSGMTDSQRNAAAAVSQRWQLPLYTLWTQYDPANSPFVDGMANEMEVEVDFETALNFVQTDGTTGSVAADSANSPAWFTDTCLQVEYLHVTEKVRGLRSVEEAILLGL